MRHYPTLRAVFGRAIAVALLSLVPLACGGDPDTAAAPADPSSSDVERVQGFLDARYAQNDVTHSFHTKFGETIDCIDFFAQAGVKQLAAQGRPITRLPQPQPPEALPPEMEEVSFNGKPDDEGKPRACPAGTAPMLRLTAAHVQAAGGLDRFVRLHSAKRPLAFGEAATTTPTLPDSAGAGYAHVTSQFNGASMSDGQATVTIYAPRVVTAPDHSIMQTWASGGGTNGLQTVEVGWNVDPGLYAGNNPQSAHLFIFSTVDGYKHGCYNNTGSGCVSFIVAPQANFAPGQTLTAAALGTAPTKLLLRTQNGDAGYGATGWNVRGVGVYPASAFNGTMTTSASRYLVGSEVYDHTQTTTAGNGGWLVPMGSGAAANAGSGQAAYWDRLSAFGPGTSSSSSFGTPTTENGPNFSFLQVADRTYVGSVPDVWWGQDFGFQFSPIGDWFFGSYKGECQLGYPVTAVSSNTSGGNSHALMCGQQRLAMTTGADCYARPLGSVDNRAFTDNGWDWDFGSVKVECESNFFVQGVAQSTSGTLDAILCCPGSVAHRSCNAEIFESSDSPSYSGGPDWDPSSYKGQCPSGKYVAGVSRRSGAAHGLLCCNP